MAFIVTIALCVKTLTKFSVYKSTSYWNESIACTFLDKSHTAVPVIFSSLSIPLYLSYILVRLVKYPHPLLFPLTTLHTIYISGLSYVL